MRDARRENIPVPDITQLSHSLPCHIGTRLLLACCIPAVTSSTQPRPQHHTLHASDAIPGASARADRLDRPLKSRRGSKSLILARTAVQSTPATLALGSKFPPNTRSPLPSQKHAHRRFTSRIGLPFRRYDPAAYSVHGSPWQIYCYTPLA